MVLDWAAGDCRNFCVCVCWRRGGDAIVELAAAAAVWLAGARVLASVGIAGAVPALDWGTGRARAGAPWRTALARAVPEYESGGAGEVSAGDAGGVWVWRWREGGAVSFFPLFRTRSSLPLLPMA